MLYLLQTEPYTAEADLHTLDYAELDNAYTTQVLK
jgi:hypothetical protein